MSESAGSTPRRQLTSSTFSTSRTTAATARRTGRLSTCCRLSPRTTSSSRAWCSSGYASRTEGGSMKALHGSTRLGLLAAVLTLSATTAWAQGRRDDYDRAEKFLPERINDLAYDGQVEPHWIGKTDRFWYRKAGPFGKQF